MNTLIHFQYESSLRFVEQKEEEAVFHRRTQPEYRKIAKRKNIRKQCKRKNIENGKISKNSGDGKIKISESIGKYRKRKIKSFKCAFSPSCIGKQQKETLKVQNIHISHFVIWIYSFPDLISTQMQILIFSLRDITSLTGFSFDAHRPNNG